MFFSPFFNTHQVLNRQRWEQKRITLLCSWWLVTPFWCSLLRVVWWSIWRKKSHHVELRFALHNGINFHSHCTFDSFPHLAKTRRHRHEARARTQRRSQWLTSATLTAFEKQEGCAHVLAPPRGRNTTLEGVKWSKCGSWWHYTMWRLSNKHAQGQTQSTGGCHPPVERDHLKVIRWVFFASSSCRLTSFFQSQPLTIEWRRCESWAHNLAARLSCITGV